jgi:hypothetical protein
MFEIELFLLAKDVIAKKANVYVFADVVKGNTDVIPIDRAEVNVMANEIYSLLEKRVNLIEPNTNLHSISIEHTFKILNIIDNQLYNVSVGVELKDLEDELVLGEALNYIQSDEKYIGLFLNSRLTKEGFFEKRNAIIRSLYIILMHELTHVFDKDFKQEDIFDPNEDYSKYFNVPQEQKSFIQHVVFEARENLYNIRKAKPKLRFELQVNEAIEGSSWFQRLKPHFTGKNLIKMKRDLLNYFKETELTK